MKTFRSIAENKRTSASNASSQCLLHHLFVSLVKSQTTEEVTSQNKATGRLLYACISAVQVEVIIVFNYGNYIPSGVCNVSWYSVAFNFFSFSR